MKLMSFRAVVVVMAAGFAGCLLRPAPAQSVVDPSLVVENVISSGGPLASPTSMVFLSIHDILVAEKNTGRVRRVIDGTVQAGSVLDLAVNTANERGLLGLALDPQFPAVPLVYVFYTRSSSGGDTSAQLAVIDQRISRFTWTGSSLTGEQVLATLPVTPGPNHDGGVIVFGPPQAAPADQKLFAVIGDLNRNNQTENFATGAPPDDSGCIIRINPDGSLPSGAQRGPFFDVAGANLSLQRMYGYGIRNSFGLAFDTHPTLGGALWDTENGTGDYDEINRVDPAFNGGWEDQQGPTGFPDVNEAAAGKVQFGGVGTYSEPEFSWRQIVAPTSIHFLNGAGLGEAYRSDCFVGGLNNSTLYRFELNAARTAFSLSGGLADTVYDNSLATPDSDASIVFGTGFAAITDLETGPDGNLYVLSLGEGQIYRIRNPNIRITGSEIRDQQLVRIASSGEGYQELFYNFTTQALTVSPYHNDTRQLSYAMPEGQWVGIYHYDYPAAAYTEAVYQFQEKLD